MKTLNLMPHIRRRIGVERHVGMLLHDGVVAVKRMMI